jgi:hypothetical protein
MHLLKIKKNIRNSKSLIIMATASVYILIMPVAVFAAVPASQKACDEKESGKYSGSNLTACVAGYKAGHSLASRDRVCNPYSGSDQDACIVGYGKGSCSIKNPGQNALNECLNQNPIIKSLRLVVNLLSAGVGIVIVGSIIVAGIQYALAGNNPNAVGAAKKRIQDTLIAMLAFFFIYAFLQWIIPGGLLFS